MKNFVIILSLTFMFFWWTQNKSVKHIPARTLASMNSCQLKKECAIIYVAPWCGACKQLLPQLKPYIESSLKNEEYGIQIVVGAGQSDEENEREAKEIGDAAIVDYDQSIARILKVRYFPSMFVVNRSQNILIKDRKTLEWITKRFPPQ